MHSVKTVKKSTLKPLVTRPSQQSSDKYIQFVEERIYGTVTLLAVNVGLLLTKDLSVALALGTIAATTFGIWLASIFAAITAYRIGNDNNMPARDVIHELTVHRGLLFAALPSLGMITLAYFSVIEIKTAIMVDIALGLVTMIATLSRSAKTQDNSYRRAIFLISLQFLVAISIIGLMARAK